MKALLLICFLSSGYVVGDVIAPQEDACSHKKAGDACEVMGQAGICKVSICYRNDYSRGVPPRSVAHDCLMCMGPNDTPVGCSETNTNMNSMLPFVSLGLGLLIMIWLRRARV